MSDFKNNDETLCFCMNIKYKEAEDVIRKNCLKTVDEVEACMQVGSGCGGCYGNIQLLLDEIANKDK